MAQRYVNNSNLFAPLNNEFILKTKIWNIESENPNIASIESQNTMIQDSHPRFEEQVKSQVNPQEE